MRPLVLVLLAIGAKGQVPVDGVWSPWSNGACTVTCGQGGTMTQTRTCTNPAPANGGAQCSTNPVGASQGGVPCLNDPCPSKTNINAKKLHANIV